MLIVHAKRKIRKATTGRAIVLHIEKKKHEGKEIKGSNKSRTIENSRGWGLPRHAWTIKKARISKTVYSN